MTQKLEDRYKIVMGDNKYRATGGALSFDAYYKDEWGIVNSSSNSMLNSTERDGFHKNTFTSVVGNIEKSQSHVFPFENKANPKKFQSLKDKSNPVPSATEPKYQLQIYFSDSVESYAKTQIGKSWDKPILLTLYFGVGTELVRHGIRSFFKNQTNMQAIVQVPGIEPEKKGDPRFGISVDDVQLKQALNNYFNRSDVTYEIKVVAAFSTGSCGLNQTLLNELVTLTNIKRLIFFDCLYTYQCGDTALAIKNLKSKTTNLKIIVYKTSEGGNSFFPGTNSLHVIKTNPILFNTSTVIENLFQNPLYIALIIFRALESAVADNVTTIPNTNLKIYNDMQIILNKSPRGLIISNKNCFKEVHGSLPSSSTYTYFEDWSKDPKNVSTIQGFYSKVGSISVNGTFRNLLWGNKIPGWSGGDGEDKHDLLIPEFGWEYLPY
jgi:hypothetical protein